MAGDKPVTVRLPQSQLRELMGLSVLDGGNLAEQIRKAVTAYIDTRLSADNLSEQIAEAKDRQVSALEALMSKH